MIYINIEGFDLNIRFIRNSLIYDHKLLSTISYLFLSYIPPFIENQLLSDLLTHGISIVLLALLNCSNTVLVRGVYIDAEEPDGQCVVFPVYYIRLFFQKERLKKQKRMMDMEKGYLSAANNHSLRQQLLRHGDKTPIVVPMNKLSSSHVNLSTVNHQHHLHGTQLPISNSNNHSQTSVSPEEVDEEQRLTQPQNNRSVESSNGDNASQDPKTQP